MPHHEWLIEFEKEPEDLNQFGFEIDKALQKHNSYYKDLIVGGVLKPLKITPISKNVYKIDGALLIHKWRPTHP